MAEVLGIHRTRVSSWQRSRAAGGTDGRIPQNHIGPLIAFARDKGLEIEVADFFPTAASVATT